MRRMVFAASVSLALLVTATSELQAGVKIQSFDVGGPAIGTQLFSAIGAPGAPGPDAGPGATLAWPVTVDTALLDTLPATLVVNFPDRAAVTLSRLRTEHRGAGGFLWTGRGGDCSGLFRLAPTGFKGLLDCANAPYGIDHAEGSTNVRLSRYSGAGTAAAADDQVALDAQPAAPAPPSGPAPLQPLVPDQTVDLLVLFNAAFAGSTYRITAQDIVDQIQFAMDNSTAAGDPAIAEIRLAGAAVISRNVDNDPAGDLRALPFDPEAIALRNYWAADGVIYITTGNGNLQGVGYIPGYDNKPPPGSGFAPWAYAVALRGVAIAPGGYVAAHEYGHTFGANHNPDHQPVNPTPIYPWAFGHWAIHRRMTDVHEAYYTIMSYRGECEADPYPHNACERILNYSNPDVLYSDWFHTGIAGQRDNAQVITDVGPIYAQYRASLGRIFASGFE